MVDEGLITALRGHAFVLGVTACGSRVTCDPAPTDTDEDWLVHVYEKVGGEGMDPAEYFHRLSGELQDQGFVLEGNEDYQDEEGMEFTSFRRGEINLICTFRWQFVDRHKLATKVCKRFNLLDKGDRVALFEAIMYTADVDHPERKDRQRRLEKTAALQHESQTLPEDKGLF